MIWTPGFLLGLATGAVAGWWLRRRSAGNATVLVSPHVVRPLTRRGRLG